mgnify:CR=1 FL=1
MIVRLVCVLASSSCIGTEPAAYVPENVESGNTDFRAVVSKKHIISGLVVVLVAAKAGVPEYAGP